MKIKKVFFMIISTTLFITASHAQQCIVITGSSQIIKDDTCLFKHISFENAIVAEGNLASFTFSSIQIGMGADWRHTSPSPAIVYDRLYVIKDAIENYFKLKFTSILTDGLRDTPQFEYALVKKGN